LLNYNYFIVIGFRLIIFDYFFYILDFRLFVIYLLFLFIFFLLLAVFVNWLIFQLIILVVFHELIHYPVAVVGLQILSLVNFRYYLQLWWNLVLRSRCELVFYDVKQSFIEFQQSVNLSLMGFAYLLQLFKLFFARLLKLL